MRRKRAISTRPKQDGTVHTVQHREWPERNRKSPLVGHQGQATYIRWDPFGGSSISEMLHWKLIQLHAKPKMSAQVEIPDAWAL